MFGTFKRDTLGCCLLIGLLSLGFLSCDQEDSSATEEPVSPSSRNTRGPTVRARIKDALLGLRSARPGTLKHEEAYSNLVNFYLGLTEEEWASLSDERINETFQDLKSLGEESQYMLPRFIEALFAVDNERAKHLGLGLLSCLDDFERRRDLILANLEDDETGDWRSDALGDLTGDLRENDPEMIWSLIQQNIFNGPSSSNREAIRNYLQATIKSSAGVLPALEKVAEIEASVDREEALSVIDSICDELVGRGEVSREDLVDLIRSSSLSPSMIEDFVVRVKNL